jgi:lysozyme
MRLYPTFGISLILVLSGCNTSSRVDALDVARPSLDVTSSVRAPVPPAEIGVGEIAAAEPVQSFPAEPLPDPASVQIPVPENAATIKAPRLKPAPPAGAADPDARVEMAFAAPPALAEKPALRGQPGTVHGPRFRDAKPIRFGRISPKHYPVHGVDVSRWQGNINWNLLKKNGANFAYIKATDGGDHLDPMFRRNWKGAQAAGVKRGAYHFFYWCRPAAHQAEWFIRHVPRDASALPPVIDVEWTRSRSCPKRPSPATVRKKMATFMNMLEAHYGQRPLIYTAPDFYEDNLQGAFPNHPFWLRAVAEHPSKVYPGRDWVLWQYSGTGLSKGVGEKIDLNVFNGDAAAWARWAH